MRRRRTQWGKEQTGNSYEIYSVFISWECIYKFYTLYLRALHARVSTLLGQVFIKAIFHSICVITCNPETNMILYYDLVISSTGKTHLTNEHLFLIEQTHRSERSCLFPSTRGTGPRHWLRDLCHPGINKSPRSTSAASSEANCPR